MGVRQSTGVARPPQVPSQPYICLFCPVTLFWGLLLFSQHSWGMGKSSGLPVPPLNLWGAFFSTVLHFDSSGTHRPLSSLQVSKKFFSLFIKTSLPLFFFPDTRLLPSTSLCMSAFFDNFECSPKAEALKQSQKVCQVNPAFSPAVDDVWPSHP